MKSVQKLSLSSVAPMSVPTNTKRSIIETPVTISGFIMGILVTELTSPRIRRERIRSSPTAAQVPITVAVTAELTARISVLRSASKTSLLRKSSRYQYRENPAKTPVLAVLLKENSIRTIMGA